VIANVSYGDNTMGLLKYLFGPGDFNEHVDQHVVGSWDGFAPDPGRDEDAAAAFIQLRDALDLRIVQAGTRAPGQHVWHCSIRADPTDRQLSDEEWDRVAQRIVSAAGIAPDGDVDGCRWVAVRHADDHIHIAATLMRGNLRQPRLRGDWLRIEEELTSIENEFGLLSLADTRNLERARTVPKRPTRAELRKAQGRGLTETPRETLRSAVRQSLAGAVSEEEFLRRLTRHGAMVSVVHHQDTGQARGYKFALPGDRNAKGDIVWFSGSSLAPDLSLPKIRARLAIGADDRPPSTSPSGSAAADSRRYAADVVSGAVEVLDHGDDAAVAAQLVGVGEVLDALADTAALRQRRTELARAARAWESAANSQIRARSADMRALRSAARAITYGGSALDHGDDGAAAVELLTFLLLILSAAATWHSAHSHEQQARAARTTAQHLRAIHKEMAARPMDTLAKRGRALSAQARDRQLAAVGQALHGEMGQRLVKEPAWDALAATLAEAEAAGHDPVALLAQAQERRELDTAESMSAVLVWRIRKIAQLPSVTTLNSGKKSGTKGAASQVVTNQTKSENTQAKAIESESRRHR